MPTPISTPAQSVPGQAMYFAGPDGQGDPVSSANPMPSVSPALAYVATNYLLTTNQAAGTDPVVLANAARRALMFSGPANFQLALAAGQSAGMRIYASARDSLIGAECPLGALYLVSGSGLSAGQILTVWEA